MPNRDASVAIEQAINSALNAKQERKDWLSIKPLIDLYPTRGGISTRILKGYNYSTL